MKNLEFFLVGAGGKINSDGYGCGAGSNGYRGYRGLVYVIMTFYCCRYDNVHGVDNGSGSGDGYRYGNGHGVDNGAGGDGYREIYSAGIVDLDSDSDCDGFGYGSGHGSGYDNSFGEGSGDGFGSDDGDGYGYDYTVWGRPVRCW